LKFTCLITFILLLFIAIPVQGQFAKAYSVVAGSGGSRDAVDKITEKVNSAGFVAFTIDFSNDKKSLYRTCSGYFSNQSDAISLRDAIKSKTGIKDAWVFNIASEYEPLFSELKTGKPVEEPEKPVDKDKDIDTQNQTPVPNSDTGKPPYLIDTSPDNAGDLDKLISIYTEINSALTKNKPDLIEKYIDPETGIIEIIDPGGIPFPIHSVSFSQAVIQGLFLSLSGKTPVKDYLPEFDCNAGIWTKKGTFISKIKNYSKLTSILPGASEIIYLDKSLLSSIEKMEYRISVIILATDESLLGFFKKEGNWYLGIIDNSFDCVQ